MNQTKHESTSGSHRRRWTTVAVVVVLSVIAFPWILAKTGLRDRLLNAIVASDDVKVSSQDASFGYLTSLSLSGLQIKASDDSAKIDVEQIESDHSWLGLLLSRPELGTFRFQRPKIDVLVKEARQTEEIPEAATKTEGDPQPIELPALTAEIRDAAVVVRSPKSVKPPIDLNNINLTLRIAREEDHSLLRIDSSIVFDRQRITPELCAQGLQLVAPLLADAVAAEGEFSLRLEEFEVPLNKEGDGSQIRVRGELQLHQASVDLKSTMTTKIVGLVYKLIDKTLPETISVVQDVKVGFQVIDGRFHHEGLAFLLPHDNSSIEISSAGSVGLDESLDIEVSIQFPPGILGESALGSRLTNEPMVIAISGTIDEPEVGLPKTANWLQSIESIFSEKDDDPTDDALEEAVSNLLDGLLNRPSAAPNEPLLDQPLLKAPLFPSLRKRLEDRRRSRRTEEPESI